MTNPTGLGLGRREAPDTRDKRFSFARVIAFKKRWWRWFRYWETGPIRNQEDTPQCVGYSWWQWLATVPIRTLTGPHPTYIYLEAQHVDEWEGTDYAGTSVRAGAKVLSSLGHVKNYLWAQTPQDLRAWVLNQGPVVVGTSWYEDMFYPDSTNRVHPTGAYSGGHAYVISGYNRIRGLYRCVNSWGEGWGDGGKFWIKDTDLERLVFTEGGEACAAVEQELAPV